MRQIEGIPLEAKLIDISLVFVARTENSIKNHWNCSLRKKLEAPSPHVTRNQQPIATEPCPQVIEQKGIFSKSEEIFSLDLVLGYAEGRENDRPALIPGNCRMMLPKDEPFMSSPVVKEGNKEMTFPTRNLSESEAHSLNPSLAVPCDTSPSASSLPTTPCNKRSDYYAEDGNTELLELRLSSLSYTQTVSSPDDGVAVDSYSVESKLRSAAKSFKNPPAIIRKRKSLTPCRSIDLDSGSDVH